MTFASLRPARALRLSAWICISLAGCATQQSVRDDLTSGDEPVRATYSVLHSIANTYGPSAEFEEPALGPDLARATPVSNSAAPQASLFTPGWMFIAGIG